ncbi:MAG: hypothetical protein JNK82_34970, partial [Myxococcaceae bacterium]|nr:hypothetical protein [Myxococcaceae bacterium]
MLLAVAGCSLSLPDVSSGNPNAVYAELDDDFERVGGTPEGAVWTEYEERNANEVLSVTAEAAHRGAGGLQFKDTQPGTGNAVCSHLIKRRDAGTAEGSLRSWLRVRGTNGQGYNISLFLESENGTDPTQGGFTGSNLIHNAESVDTGQNIRNTNLPFDAGVWMLYELSVRECDDAGACSARLLVDGRERSQWPIRRGTTRVFNFGVGAVFCGAEFQGTVDFDDVRFHERPLASTLVVTGDSAAPSECAPLRVELRDSFGAPADAPYDVEATVWVDGGATYGDPA